MGGSFWLEGRTDPVPVCLPLVWADSLGGGPKEAHRHGYFSQVYLLEEITDTNPSR
jgi:hypothetical protein